MMMVTTGNSSLFSLIAVNFEYNKPFGQQIYILVRIQQKIIATSFVILPEGCQQII